MGPFETIIQVIILVLPKKLHLHVLVRRPTFFKFALFSIAKRLTFKIKFWIVLEVLATLRRFFFLSYNRFWGFSFQTLGLLKIRQSVHLLYETWIQRHKFLKFSYHYAVLARAKSIFFFKRNSSHKLCWKLPSNLKYILTIRNPEAEGYSLVI